MHNAQYNRIIFYGHVYMQNIRMNYSKLYILSQSYG